MVEQPGNNTLRFSAEENRARLFKERLLAVSAIGDGVVLFLSLYVGYLVRFESPIAKLGVQAAGIRVEDYLPLIAIGVAILLVTYALLELYRVEYVVGFRKACLIIVKGTVLWLCAYLGISLGLKFDPPISRMYAGISFVVGLSGVLCWRKMLQMVTLKKGGKELLGRKVMFVGWSREAETLYRAMAENRDNAYVVVGWVSCRSAGEGEQKGHSVVGQLENAIREGSRTDVVVVGEVEASADLIKDIRNFCEQRFIEFKVIPSYFQRLISGLHLEVIGGVPVLGVDRLPLDKTGNVILKRGLDIVGGLVGLACSVPVFVVCGVLVVIESPGPVVFRQMRVGIRGRTFTMYKLRTMRMGAEEFDEQNLSTQREDPRVLKIGAWMRRFNLDETPQFWNVLKGDMSLVGPRPERSYHSQVLSSQIAGYNARYAHKPGMTGWAQVNGLRGDTSLASRVDYDIYYLENWSIWLDIQILCLTMFRNQNAY